MINLLDLKKQGRINEYFYSKLCERSKICPENLESLTKQAMVMTAIGVKSEEDHKRLFYITRHLKTIISNLAAPKLGPEALARLSADIFSRRNEVNIGTMFEFYKAAAQSLIKSKIPIKKIAYPQGYGVGFIETPRDLSKWMQAMRSIYAMGQQPGCDLPMAFKLVTQNWDNMERRDFKHWMSFYEENAHQKYKTADDKYYQAAPGVMIPIDHLKAKLPMGNSGPDVSSFNLPPNPQEEKAAKTEEIKKKLKAIIGRLNAAERIATDPDVQDHLKSRMVDMPLPNWVRILQDLKRAIQLAPIKNAGSSIFEDLIIKQANILKLQGHPKAAREMYKFAQVVPGSISEPPSEVPVALPAENTENGEEALDEFIEGMSLGGDTDDTNDIEDMEDDPLASITVIAQALPEVVPPTKAPTPAAPLDQGPVVEEEEKEVAKTEMHTKTDNLLEAALSNVTLNDVIGRLETLANLFRTREIPRQLAIIDLMMDRLNISAFFPSLAEASSKSLESNQYALTRVEEILSKLRGAVKTPAERELDLTGTEAPTEVLPEVHPGHVRQTLQNQEVADKARKQRRKNEQEAAEQIAAQPITNVTEDLAQPVVPTAPAV